MNLVTAQEAFFSDNNDYAGSTITTGPQTNGTGGAGKVSFVPSKGNVLALDLRLTRPAGGPR